MKDLASIVNTLTRPSLLIRAARCGLNDYNRDRSLRRLMRGTPVPSPQSAVGSLLSVEADLEQSRTSGDAAYSVARHVEVLIALIAEARALTRPDRAPV